MKNKKIFIIAEAGINHNGSLNQAFKLVKKAKEIGSDAIKFQTFKAENVVTLSASQAKYQEKNSAKKESQYSMIKKLELDYTDFNKLYLYSKKMKIEFISSAFDIESLLYLNKMGQRIFTRRYLRYSEL